MAGRLGVVEEVRAPWGFCSCPVCACPSPRPRGGGLCCGAVASGAVGVEEGCSQNTKVLREELKEQQESCEPEGGGGEGPGLSGRSGQDHSGPNASTDRLHGADGVSGRWTRKDSQSERDRRRYLDGARGRARMRRRGEGGVVCACFFLVQYNSITA